MNSMRAEWTEAYKFHAAALKKLGTMEQRAFWTWYHQKAIEIANTYNNTALILGLLVAIFENVEATAIAARQSESA